MKRLVYISFLLLAGCGYDDFDAPSPGGGQAPAANLTIASLRGHYHGQAVLFTQDMVVAGRVVSSDKAGNFYRTLLIDDGTGGLEVLAGLYDLHNDYPVGQRVAVSLRGLAADMEAGVLRTGLPAPAYTGRTTDYMGHVAIVREYLAREGMPQAVQAADVAAGALREEMCGRLVRVAGLRLTGAGPSAMEVTGELTWAPPASGGYTQTGYRKFKDAAGDSLIVVTSGYATFAAGQIPSGEVCVTGVLYYGAVAGSGGKEMFQIKMRGVEDAQTGL